MISIPTIPSLAKACLICLTAAAFLPAAAARPSFDNETASTLSQHTDNNDWRSSPFILVEDPWPAQIGMPPQFDIKMSTWQLLRKRECLENGSNFCFDGNPQKSCPDCGSCCTLGSDEWCCKDAGATCCSGKKCCSAGTACCGDGCCAEGSTCSDGKCEVPVVTTTTTTTIQTTVTHTEVEMVTVQNLVVETSTINSIITKTVTSDDGTQTEVTYSTTTVQAGAKLKRAAEPTPGPVNPRRHAEGYVMEEESRRGLARRMGRKVWRNLVYGGDQAPFDLLKTRISPTQPRQCQATTTPRPLLKRQGDGTSTVTQTVTKTETKHTTTHEKKSTTVDSTSVFETTIFQTSTKVAGAKATVSTTSIITITARKATTQTITSTSTFLIDPTGLPADDGTDGTNTGNDPHLNDPSSSSTKKKKKKGLSSSAVIGIGVGAGLLGLTLLIAGFFWRRHQKNKPPRAYDFTYDPAPQMTSPASASPRRPTLPFGGAAVVSHHDTSYTPTVSEMHTDPTPDSYNRTSNLGAAGAAVGAGGAAMAAGAARGHTRNSSSVSKPLIPSGQTSPDPYADPYGESGQSWPPSASEMPAEGRYELYDEEVAAPAPLRTQHPPQVTPPPPVPPPRNQYRTGPHPSTSSISRVTRFAELDG